MTHELNDILAFFKRGVSMLESHVNPSYPIEGQTFPVSEYREFPKQVTRSDGEVKTVMNDADEKAFMESEPEPVPESHQIAPPDAEPAEGAAPEAAPEPPAA